MSSKKTQKESWFKGLDREFKKIVWPDKMTVAKETAAVVSVSVVLGAIIALVDFFAQYVVDLLKVNIDKTIENRHLEDQILEVRVPLEDVVEMKNGVQKVSQKKMFPGYVLIHMIMNDDTWYVVRNTRGVTGFVGPGSKPVPLTDAEMAPLGIQREEVVMDYEEGDTVQVIAGAWADTVGVIQSINMQKQSLTINVELFGRETPVEIGFAEVKKM